MKPDPYKAEYDYILNERLGMMCGTDKPTPEQLEAAEKAALAYVRQCREEEERRLKEQLES